MSKEVDLHLDDLEEDNEPVMETSELLVLKNTMLEKMGNEETSSEKVAGWIYRYIDQHSSFFDLKRENWHLSVLAMCSDVKLWIMQEMGDPYAYWYLMLDAAKEWFPEGDDSRFKRVFCHRLEIEYLSCASDVPGFVAVMKVYDEWRGFRS